MAAAKWVQNDPSGKAQYFRARLPALRTGDTVEYIPICSCAGRQVPSPDQVKQFASFIRVTDAQRRSAQGLRTSGSDSGDLHQATDWDAADRRYRHRAKSENHVHGTTKRRGRGELPPEILSLILIDPERPHLYGRNRTAQGYFRGEVSLGRSGGFLANRQ